MFKFHRILLSIGITIIVANAFASDLPIDVEESKSPALIEDSFANDSSVLMQDEEIKMDRFKAK